MPIDYLPIETVMFRINVQFPEGILYSFQLLDQIRSHQHSWKAESLRRGRAMTWSLPLFSIGDLQDSKLEVPSGELT